MYWDKQMLSFVVHTHIRVIVIRFPLKTQREPYQNKHLF